MIVNLPAYNLLHYLDLPIPYPRSNWLTRNPCYIPAPLKFPHFKASTLYL
jgi:hypothetical protein